MENRFENSSLHATIKDLEILFKRGLSEEEKMLIEYAYSRGELNGVREARAMMGYRGYKS